MFKNVVSISAALVLALALVGCSGAAKPEVAKYQDVKDSVASMIASVDKFSVALDGVKDAPGAVVAIDAFVAEYGTVLKAAADIDAKYPELKDETNAPAELKEILAGAKDLGTKLQAAMAKLAPYAADKTVTDSLAKLTDLAPKQ